MQLIKNYTLISLAFILNSAVFSQDRITIEAGYKSLKEFTPELSSGASSSSGSCGHCTKYNDRKDTPLPGKGAYIQATLHFKRIFIPIQIGLLKWNDNMQGRSVEVYHHPNAPSGWGPIVNYEEYIINYRSVSHYLHVSPGIGVNLLKPEWKFHLGPIVRFNPQFLLSRREIENSVVRHYKNYQNNGSINIETYSEPEPNAKDYITFKQPYDNRIKYNALHLICASAGISSSGVLFHSFGYSIETGYQLQNFSRVALGGIQQKSSFYLQFGLLYQIK